MNDNQSSPFQVYKAQIEDATRQAANCDLLNTIRLLQQLKFDYVAQMDSTPEAGSQNACDVAWSANAEEYSAMFDTENMDKMIGIKDPFMGAETSSIIDEVEVWPYNSQRSTITPTRLFTNQSEVFSPLPTFHQPKRQISPSIQDESEPQLQRATSPRQRDPSPGSQLPPPPPPPPPPPRPSPMPMTHPIPLRLGSRLEKAPSPSRHKRKPTATSHSSKKAVEEQIPPFIPSKGAFRLAPWCVKGGRSNMSEESPQKRKRKD